LAEEVVELEKEVGALRGS